MYVVRILCPSETSIMHSASTISLSDSFDSHLAPMNEMERLDALHKLRILDTPAEKSYDDIVQLASRICEAPISAVSLIDSDRQWFKAKIGVDVSETPRNVSFCSHVVHQKSRLIVPDASMDPRFSRNSLVVESPNIRFYAGAPIVASSGFALGAL